MDIRMPGMDGIEACERIRQLDGGREIAIIFVTAQRDVSTFDRALAAGGDDFITKPFRTEELVMRVETAMRLRRISSERTEAVGELKRQRDELQRLELQKEQLVAFLVHDLKNPVNAIYLHAQIIARETSLEAAQSAAGSIRDQARALTRMIMNLLDISKADEGRLRPSPTKLDANALASGVLESMALRAAAAKVKLKSEVAVDELHVDPDLISRVLINLVDNAIRHSPAGSAVRLAIASAGDGVEVRVADVGAGVPPAERERIFERYLSGSTAGLTNRGLGLSFCKVAIEAHGGRIWVEDGSPGAVFCVRLGPT
jgi:signal transduction histidine kinase